LREQQAGELKRQTQSVDVQEGRFRIFTQKCLEGEFCELLRLETEFYEAHPAWPKRISNTR
jgi:hypothetical protein